MRTSVSHRSRLRTVVWKTLAGYPAVHMHTLSSVADRAVFVCLLNRAKKWTFSIITSSDLFSLVAMSPLRVLFCFSIAELASSRTNWPKWKKRRLRHWLLLVTWLGCALGRREQVIGKLQAMSRKPNWLWTRPSVTSAHATWPVYFTSLEGNGGHSANIHGATSLYDHAYDGFLVNLSYDWLPLPGNCSILVSLANDGNWSIKWIAILPQ